MALSTANHFAVFIDSKKYLEKVQWTKGISSGTGLYLSANGKLQVSKTMETFSRYYQVQNFKLLKSIYLCYRNISYLAVSSINLSLHRDFIQFSPTAVSGGHSEAWLRMVALISFLPSTHRFRGEKGHASIYQCDRRVYRVSGQTEW